MKAAHRIWSGRIVVPALLLAGLAFAAVPHANADTQPGDAGASADADNWPGFGRTAGEQHYSPLTEINADNVGGLGLLWSFDLPAGNSVSAPVAVDGVLYIATGYSVVRAFDAVTGALLWEYDPKAPEASGRKLRQGWGIRGLAYGDGRIYVGTHDGRLIALDSRSGRLLWSAMTMKADDGRYITGAPRFFGGKVIIGHGGADVDDIRGYVATYDAATGKELWRFHTVPGNPADGFENEAMEMAARTWSGEWWKYGGGGTVWNAMTYDPGQDLIILGTGNGAPWNHKVRSEGKGDNLFLASIVALDASTGRYRWHYQVNPGETWDFNAAMDMQLADLRIDGKVRQVLMTAPKNGFFYVIDRTNGALISAEPFVKVTWATSIDRKTGRPVEVAAARDQDGRSFTVWPGPIGGHSWLPMAFSPRTGLTYIPALELGTLYADGGAKAGQWKRIPGFAMDGGTAPDFNIQDPEGRHGTSRLIAWDPVRQKPAWTVDTPGMWNGGVLATGGNLVFQGRSAGSFNAYAADTGKQLWSFAAEAPVLAPPISYRAGGRQLVTVLTGIGTSPASFGLPLPVNTDYHEQARRVLTFAIGGKAVLPPSPPQPTEAAEDPDFRPDLKSAGKGAVTYAMRCGVCHGANVVAGGQAPDLRRSGVPQSDESFRSVVKEGLLIPNGMPDFTELSDSELADLRHYIRTEAAGLRNGAQARRN